MNINLWLLINRGSPSLSTSYSFNQVRILADQLIDKLRHQIHNIFVL